MNKIFITGLVLILLASVSSFFGANWFLFFNAAAFAALLYCAYRFSDLIKETKIAMLLKDDNTPSVLCTSDGMIVACNALGGDTFGQSGNVIDNLKNQVYSQKKANEENIQIIEKEFLLKSSNSAVLFLGPDGEKVLYVRIRYVKELQYFLLTAKDETDRLSWQTSLIKQNEQAFSLLDNVAIGLYVCDKQGHILVANTAFCGFFGVDASDMSKYSIQDFTEEDLLNFEGSKDAVFSALNGQKNTFFLSQFVSKNNRYGAIIPNASEITDKDKELALTRNHIAWLFGETPLGIALLDEKEMVYEVNPPLQKMLNLSSEDLLNKKIPDIIKHTDIDGLLSKMQRVITGELNAAKCEIKLVVAEDKAEIVKIFEIFIRPTRNVSSANKDKVTGLILHFFDATEWRNMEMQFEQAQKMQGMGEMAGEIAHEFNNTLTAILGFCEFLLERHPAGDPSFADIRRIVDNANRSANLVRQLLAFSRKQSLVPRITDTCEAVADIMDMLRQLVGRGIEIKESYGRNLGYIRVDQGQLGQVFTNLAWNSKDAMHDKGIITLNVESFDVTEPWQIGSETVSSGKFVKFEFSDTGDGIKKEYLERIFEPFFSTKSDRGAGTGLGLAAVYGIIKQTDGYIKVESAEGQGTTFTILLPRYERPKDYIPLPSLSKLVASKPSLVTIAASTSVGEKEEIEVPQYNGSKQSKILLAEDEMGVRMFVARALAKKGYNVTVCDNGVAALQKLQNGEVFDLLLTDMSMPAMTGAELAVEAKKILPSMKIIIMSGFSEDIAKGVIADEKEICFLAKPFNLQQLSDKVKEIMEGNQSDERE